MKKYLLLITYNISLIAFCAAQNPLVKQWDKRFGGTFYDELYSFQQTDDGGYILGGLSNSVISGDKTVASWAGSVDYWIIKIDSLGIKQWDKVYGGTNSDFLISLQQTDDGGYILGGWSYSGIGGDKTQDNWDTTEATFDYWIVKTDSLGNKQWDKDFGGISDEKLYSVQQTADGGYILGGYSLSGISGNKTQPNWDTLCNPSCQSDYWIVKTDSLGNKQWDKVFGGFLNDQLYSLQQTADAGYILGGYSYNGISGNKTQANWGLSDFWIVKTDSLGIMQWDKDFGATHYDQLYSLKQTADGGYILAGLSSSGINGDKTEATWGNYDYWILKTDSLGNKEWDKDFGGISIEDSFGNISLTADGGYLLAGSSGSPISGNKTENNLGANQTWTVKTNSTGIKQWDKTLRTNTPLYDLSGFAIQTEDGCYAMANWTRAGAGGDKTQPNWDTISTNSSADYWFIKFCDSTSTTSITQLPNYPNTLSLYPNPAKEYVTINYHFKAGDEIQLTDVLGKLLFTTKIKTPSSDFRLPASDLSPGIYFLKAGNEVRKFVKE